MRVRGGECETLDWISHYHRHLFLTSLSSTSSKRLTGLTDWLTWTPPAPGWLSYKETILEQGWGVGAGVRGAVGGETLDRIIHYHRRLFLTSLSSKRHWHDYVTGLTDLPEHLWLQNDCLIKRKFLNEGLLWGVGGWGRVKTLNRIIHYHRHQFLTSLSSKRHRHDYLTGLTDLPEHLRLQNDCLIKRKFLSERHRVRVKTLDRIIHYHRHQFLTSLSSASSTQINDRLDCLTYLNTFRSRMTWCHGHRVRGRHEHGTHQQKWRRWGKRIVLHSSARSTVCAVPASRVVVLSPCSSLPYSVLLTVLLTHV